MGSTNSTACICWSSYFQLPRHKIINPAVKHSKTFQNTKNLKLICLKLTQSTTHSWTPSMFGSKLHPNVECIRLALHWHKLQKPSLSLADNIFNFAENYSILRTNNEYMWMRDPLKINSSKTLGKLKLFRFNTYIL